jgi:hypothetical protein
VLVIVDDLSVDATVQYLRLWEVVASVPIYDGATPSTGSGRLMVFSHHTQRTKSF